MLIINAWLVMVAINGKFRELSFGAYCRGLLLSAGQEQASCDSAPPRVAPLNYLNGHNSTTNCRSTLIQVSLGSQGSVTKVSPSSHRGFLAGVPDPAGTGCQAPQDLAAGAEVTGGPPRKFALFAFSGFLGSKTWKRSTLWVAGDIYIFPLVR